MDLGMSCSLSHVRYEMFNLVSMPDCSRANDGRRGHSCGAHLPPAPASLVDDLAEIWAILVFFRDVNLAGSWAQHLHGKRTFSPWPLPAAGITQTPYATRVRDLGMPIPGHPAAGALPTRDTAAHPAAATQTRWAPVLGGGQVRRGVPSRAACGAEPGWREVPSPGASSPRRLFPSQLQREGKRGAGAAGASWGHPEPEAPAAAERDLAVRAEFRSPLFLPVLYTTPSPPESRSGRPSEAQTSPGSVVKLLSELQSRERSGAVKRGGHEERYPGSCGCTPRRTGRCFPRGSLGTLSPRGGMQDSGCELVTR